MLLVRTGRISFIPEKVGDGRIRLGYVETEETGFIRDALIGFAPLLVGMIFVGIIGKERLGFLTIWRAMNIMDLDVTIEVVKNILTLPNYWLWFYITTTVSCTMMPSQSDRRAWFSFSLAVALIILFGFVIGLGPFFIDSLLQPINRIFQSMALACSFSIFIQGIVILPIIFLKKIIGRITGVTVQPVPN
jgi:hypothetical protein